MLKQDLYLSEFIFPKNNEDVILYKSQLHKGSEILESHTEVIETLEAFANTLKMAIKTAELIIIQTPQLQKFITENLQEINTILKEDILKYSFINKDSIRDQVYDTHTKIVVAFPVFKFKTKEEILKSLNN